MMDNVGFQTAKTIHPWKPQHILATQATFASLALLVCIFAPLIGPTQIDLTRVFDQSIPFTDNIDAQIFFIARLPRALAGALVGGTLAAAGVVLQALLRNPLATPFTLGVSAGASLGAMIVIVLGIPLTFFGMAAVPFASFSGSLVAITIVYMLARLRGQGLATHVLLLAGVTLNSLFSAIIMFVQYLGDFSQNFTAVRWLMGNLDISSYDPIVSAMPMLVIAFVGFSLLPRSLNLISLGTEHAANRGVDVLQTQRLAFFSASLATGAAISIAGPIGFIGIIVPHFVRLIVGADHRLVLPSAVFLGAAFLVTCDVIARTVMSPVELPVGVITAILGGPFFLWLLIRTR